MAEIRITLPDEKSELLVNAVKYHMELEPTIEAPVEVTPLVAKEWLKKRAIADIKGLVKVYQQAVYEENFVYEDPLE